MKRLLGLLLCLLVACAAPACVAEAGGSEGVLYRVRNGSNTVYLLGSIHIGTADMYPVSDTLLAALDEADSFWFECDTDSKEAYLYMMQATSYTGEERLYEHLTAETYELVRQAAQKLGLPAKGLDTFRPWAVMSTFSTYVSAEVMGESDLNAATRYGVEAFVKERAGERPVGFLETAESQIATLESFTPELMDHLVATTCQAYLDPSQLTGADADMALWPGWWHDGRIDRFAESYLGGYLEPGYEALGEEYHQKLVLGRNVGMADGVEPLLTDGSSQTAFVTVGLLHLVLPEGSVPALLRERGYEVEVISERIEN